MERLRDPNRLAALERSGLMRKDAGPRLTHVCYTVTQLLDTDVAMLNVLTETEQRHVAEWPPVASPRPLIPLAESGCREVVTSNEPVVVPDTREHPVMCTLPWSATWRGYLAAPVKLDGYAIGSLCALTVATRPWKPQDVQVMTTLSTLVSASLEPIIEMLAKESR